MTVEELVDQLISDAQSLEQSGLQKDRLRRVVIHTLNETLAWAAARTPQPVQDTGGDKE